MSVKVIYYSRSGKTQKVADAIGEVCGVEAINITNEHILGDVDLLFVGTGIYAGKPDPVLLNYLDNLPNNSIKGAAIFSTSATGKNHTELIVNLLEHKGIPVYPKQLSTKGSFLFVARNHPNEEDLKEARQFANEVLTSFKW